jgi:hypothetical protein
MSELDDLERDLLETANVWFAQSLHLKMQRLIAIARNGERAMARLDEWVAKSPYAPSVPVDQPAAPRSSPGGGVSEAFVKAENERCERAMREPIDTAVRFHEDQL